VGQVFNLPLGIIWQVEPLPHLGPCFEALIVVRRSKIVSQNGANEIGEIDWGT